ncbi:hypothetical protein [Roseimicrobium sp. ORNL1]|uniref:hypothetical protein n=1 Tax=Roseimicrobium sp. ORNL1 TaxID=2711231 RepID=UPI0013E18101|nr:hypothetical protein [Roseimicrobium sp. ORNL1]QIF00082.1 hypothetical protein G5S37_00620 [Roseimicrobium sp. ORNL1]
MNPNQPKAIWVSSVWKREELDGKTISFRLDSGTEILSGVGTLSASGRYPKTDNRLLVHLSSENYVYPNGSKTMVEFNQGLMDALKKLPEGAETDFSLNVVYRTTTPDSPPSSVQ